MASCASGTAPAFHKTLIEHFTYIETGSLSTEEFLTTLRAWFESSVPRDPGQWTFGDLQRKEDGSFLDVDLVELLKIGTDTTAGAFGARNVPPALRAIEILGIQQGREWGLASLNEFRSFFKLKPFSTFKEMNTQPGIAEARKCRLALFRDAQ